ncbi:MAG: GNAT family N-acetyltransferase [Bacteroidales bacterium]|jgi:ribosomal-protein-serine acetyltransferase|nr:GNAT family N-acetyltransferase [Bacteroidales bacterium]
METLKINNNLYLRLIRFTDAVAIFNAIDKHREYFKEWLPFVDYTQSVSDSEDFVNSILNNNSRFKDIVYSIIYDEQFVGLIAFKEIDFLNKRTEIGYWLSADYQGKGIITESVEKMIDYAFETLNLNRIQIKCAVGNIKSINIPKRLGFKFEGIERDGEFYSEDKFFDIEVYSILKREWI